MANERNVNFSGHLFRFLSPRVFPIYSSLKADTGALCTEDKGNHFGAAAVWRMGKSNGPFHMIGILVSHITHHPPTPPTK